MGGVVPLGYRVENRALHVVEEHAVFIRDLFRRYLEIGGVVRLKAILDREDARSPLRRADQPGPISARSYRTRSTLGGSATKARFTKAFTIRSSIRRRGTGSSFCLRIILSARPAIARAQTPSLPASCSMTAATG